MGDPRDPGFVGAVEIRGVEEEAKIYAARIFRRKLLQLSVRPVKYGADVPGNQKPTAFYSRRRTQGFSGVGGPGHRSRDTRARTLRESEEERRVFGVNTQTGLLLRRARSMFV